MEESSEPETWRTVWSFESQESLSLAAVHALEAVGIIVPRKPLDCGSSSSSSSCFRVPLCVHQETLPYQLREGPILHLPRVFVETVQFLERNVDREGLFRKTGSVTRQKALRATLEAGGSLPPFAIVNDVASLLKQYLRELPDPLIPSHLTPVFESCHSQLERQRCLLTACLLLPPVHLQCLCVLLQLLSSVAGREDSSLMDTGSLAVVMAPNLLCSSHTPLALPHLDGSLKVHTAVVKELIESCNLIGRVPPDVVEHARRIVDNPEESGEGVMGGEEELPTRMRKKNKKQRSSSISGLVLGLGNRLKSFGGHLPSTPTRDYSHIPTSSPSTERGVVPGHMTKLGKAPSFKRRGNSCEDLTESNACKKPALLPPHPRTPLNNHKKRRSLLTRRRHTDHLKHAHKPSFFSFPQQLFKPSVGTVKIDFSSQPAAIKRSPEWKGGEGERVQLVGFASLQSPQTIAVTNCRTRRKEVVFAGLPDSEVSDDAIPQPAVVDVPLRLNGDCPPDIGEQVAEFKATVASKEVELLCLPKKEASQKETHAHETRALPVEPRSTAYHSRLLLQSHSMFPLPTPPHTTSSIAYKAKKSSAKRRRCEADSGDTVGMSGYATELEWAKPAQSASGTAFRLESHPGIVSTSEDANRKGSSAEIELPSIDASGEKPETSGRDVNVPAASVPVTRSGLPSSSSMEQLVSTPTPFIFQGTLGVRASKSDYQLKVPQFNFVDHNAVFRFTKNSPMFGGPAKIPTSHSHPFLPHFSTKPRSEDPDATPMILKTNHKGPYTFSNPTPVHTRSEQSVSEMSVRECEEIEEFESGQKTAECKEATLLDEFDPGSNNTMEMDSLEESSESLMGAIPSASTPLGKLDEGFLKTPLPFHSPNLLEKISLEIAARHQFSPSTPLLPEGALKINDSYKQAVLGENYLLPIAGPTALKFDASFSDTSDVSLNKTTDKGPGIAVLQNGSKGEGGVTVGEEMGTGTGSCKTTADLKHTLPTAHPVLSLKLPTPEMRSRIAHKAHHKRERSDVCLQAPPTPSIPHHFTFSLPSPWSRGRGGGEAGRISKRAQVYMVSMATDSSSHLPPTPSHKPHNMHKGVRRHHSHRVANKENASDSVRGGKAGHTTHRAIQVKEWIV